ncbi:hypothetical protein Pfo_014329 [Paulownia fortunei]|nr:hypothetical protein Pfo_014329 [Paulownia fortunei]
MKRYRNGRIWHFEHEVTAAAQSNGDTNDKMLNCSSVDGREVELGIDGGTTSTPLPDPLAVLARAVAGCSNHNSIGETAALQTLEHVMADALSKAASTHSAVQAVCLSVSGINHTANQHRIAYLIGSEKYSPATLGYCSK